jgi:hypothetical protein
MGDGLPHQLMTDFLWRFRAVQIAPKPLQHASLGVGQPFKLFPNRLLSLVLTAISQAPPSS